mgnify:CR=1 FL=1
MRMFDAKVIFRGRMMSQPFVRLVACEIDATYAAIAEQHAHALVLLGEIHQGEGRNKQARAAYERYLKLQPRGEQAQAVRGMRHRAAFLVTEAHGLEVLQAPVVVVRAQRREVCASHIACRGGEAAEQRVERARDLLLNLSIKCTGRLVEKDVPRTPYNRTARKETVIRYRSVSNPEVY